VWGDRSGERVHPDDAICGVELLLRLFAHGGRFFTDGWSVFDLLTVSIALVPRVLRLMSAVPAMRRVVLPATPSRSHLVFPRRARTSQHAEHDFMSGHDLRRGSQHNLTWSGDGPRHDAAGPG
jgi:hypothetical protein